MRQPRCGYFFLAAFFFAGLAADLVDFLAAFLAGLATVADFFLPLEKAASQPSEYFFVVPTRTIVTAVILTS